MIINFSIYKLYPKCEYLDNDSQFGATKCDSDLVSASVLAFNMINVAKDIFRCNASNVLKTFLSNNDYLNFAPQIYTNIYTWLKYIINIGVFFTS